MSGEEAPLGTPSYSEWGNPDAADYRTTRQVRVAFMGRMITWHKWAVWPLKAVERDLLTAGYQTGHWWADVQTYNNRFIAGTHTKSLHSWPLALDIDVAHNPQGKPLRTDFPAGLVACFERHGFRWGGHWSTPDAMHFEYIGPPVKAQPQEVEDVTIKEHEMLAYGAMFALEGKLDAAIAKAYAKGAPAAGLALEQKRDTTRAYWAKRWGIDALSEAGP
jgi:hypothetical protein